MSDAAAIEITLALGAVVVLAVVIAISVHHGRVSRAREDRIVELLVQIGRVPADTASRDELMRLLFSGQISFNLQPKVVAWVSNLLRDGVGDPSRLATASTIVARLWFSAPDLASLYQQSLEVVQSSKGAPAAKELALRLGRLSYAAGRPDRRPTVYDEQAVANDIAMRA